MNLLDVIAQKARVAGLVAAACAVTGVATAAAVAPSFTNVDSSTEVVATASPEATESAAPEATATPTDAPTDAPAVAPTEAPAPAVTAGVAATDPAPCPSDAKNHGQYVSSVARDKSTHGRDHGKAVSAAAKSDCGKTAGDATDSSDASEPGDAGDTDSEAPEAPESDAPDADGPAATVHGKAKAHKKH